MRNFLLLAGLVLVLSAAQLVGQRQFVESPVDWEVEIVLPREVSPARYEQVNEQQLRQMARDGWEPVGVTPYVLLNEERGPEGRKAMVTQTYPAYMFRRVVDPRRRRR